MTERTGRNRRAVWQALAGAIIVVIAAGVAPLRGAELLDRVIAVVSGTVITLSDARAAVALGVVDTRQARDPIEAALRWFVDRQLVVDEATRSGPLDVDDTLVNREVEAIRRRFSSASDYRAALARLGLDDARVLRLVRETVAARQYVERRFDTILPPTDDELREFFGRHQERFVRGGRQLTIDEALDEVRVMVQQERRQQAVAAWMDRLRRRADINELYLPVRRP